LVLPHVEEDGRVCLGSNAPPAAYENPVWAALGVLERFKADFLDRTSDDAWVMRELQEERLSYWARHCDRSRGNSPTAPRTTWLSLPDAPKWRERRWMECATAAYAHPHARQRRYGLQLITAIDLDPNQLAQRHQWAAGALVRGRSLLIALPNNSTWTPSTWPTDFVSLEALIAASTDGQLQLRGWVDHLGWEMSGAKEMRKRVSWKREVWVDEPPLGYAPRIVVILDGSTPYGYQLSPPTLTSKHPILTPVTVTRVDRHWALSRDHQTAVVDGRHAKRVLLIGCGSLGSPLAELLARAGVGHLDLVDAEEFDSPNVARHVLGLPSLKKSKAVELAARIQQLVPGCSVHGHPAEASGWLVSHFRPEEYDLVVECTGESSVRTMMSAVRDDLLGACPVVHAWVEPFCSAAHVVVSPVSMPWPAADPADALVNAADFGAGGAKVALPACNSGFHPYGAADVVQAAAFAAERVIGVLDDESTMPAVYSWIRSKAFFDNLGVQVAVRPVVPTDGGRFSAVMIERSLEQLLAT
jgi:hypothetical protein